MKRADVVIPNVVRLLLLRSADHAAISYHRYIALLEGCFETLDLGAEGLEIIGLTGKQAHADGLASGIGEQSHHDLAFPLDPIAVVTKSSQGVVRSLEVGACDIVEEEARGPRRISVRGLSGVRGRGSVRGRRKKRIGLVPLP